MTPTGRLFGTDLVLTRTFRAPAEDVWASVTEPERTARWFGAWEGEARPGATIKVQLGFEDGAPWCETRIEECAAPTRLALSMTDEAGSWRLEVLLTETGGTTELKLVHHLENVDSVGEVGPGWEYYLDLLVASRDGTPQPSFDDYYPAMKPYFENLR
ncbi:SRPBCC family protein [Actinokineospora sp. UTMC 2448]|uniref:SRPBCC family protein n=1 Tax=Actinokineospora sp. UTMC 2448 TaxID=2268449 RepID=UPI00216435C2|nr:SRPBCC family protein [Actinokineospora sp. UTMC 2448]UVS78536.1 Activator of Hsp90 ATPase [Actinokineospora sp. UTMC 2448]